MPTKPVRPKPTPESRLREFIGRLPPKMQKLFRSVRAAIRKRFPTANELAYDYGHAVVVGYAPAEHGIDSIVAIRVTDAGVSLYFSQGPRLPDPNKLLQGTGKQVRFIPVEVVKRLAEPDVDALIVAAVRQARVPFPAIGKGTLIIKSDGAKKPTRRKPLKRLCPKPSGGPA